MHAAIAVAGDRRQEMVAGDVRGVQARSNARTNVVEKPRRPRTGMLRAVRCLCRTRHVLMLLLAQQKAVGAPIQKRRGAELKWLRRSV